MGLQLCFAVYSLRAQCFWSAFKSISYSANLSLDIILFGLPTLLIIKEFYSMFDDSSCNTTGLWSCRLMIWNFLYIDYNVKCIALGPCQVYPTFLLPEILVYTWFLIDFCKGQVSGTFACHINITMFIPHIHSVE